MSVAALERTPSLHGQLKYVLSTTYYGKAPNYLYLILYVKVSWPEVSVGFCQLLGDQVDDIHVTV